MHFLVGKPISTIRWSCGAIIMLICLYKSKKVSGDVIGFAAPKIHGSHQHHDRALNLLPPSISVASTRHHHRHHQQQKHHHYLRLSSPNSVSILKQRYHSRSSPSVSLFLSLDSSMPMAADTADSALQSFAIAENYNFLHQLQSLLPLDNIATVLGYAVGAGSFLLYTPIAIRVLRRGSADGLTLSTWYLKLVSYTCSDIYAYSNGYDISTYAETIVITVEAMIILLLVASYQRKIATAPFVSFAVLYTALTAWGSLSGLAPAGFIAVGQAGSTVLNTGAIIPQLRQNDRLSSSGDYSPVTALLASVGCFVRCFTTVQLNGSDPLLLTGYGIALILNVGLLLQILYYGVRTENQSIASVFLSDIQNSEETEKD